MLNLLIKKPSHLVITLFIISISWVNFNNAKWNLRSVVEWDIVHYYSYLPAVFIEKDIKLSFIGDKAEEYMLKKMYVPHRAENGNYVIKTTIGLSVLYLPFFLLAHGWAHLFGYDISGFSEPYQFALQFSALFYVVVGFLFLRKTLLQYFNEGVVAFTLLCLAFGTNLFYYTSIAGPMPHAYLFFLTSLIIYYTIQWHKLPSFKKSLIIGASSGLLILIRPVNGLVLLFFVFMNVENLAFVREKLLLFFRNFKYLLVISFTILLCFVPQFIYWKYVAGEYLYFGYIGKQFFFNHPHLLEGLFGFRKGWLLYTPIMAFSIIGLFYLYKQQKQFFLSVILVFIIFTYVILCWWCWWYGGCFGQRGMIDIFPLLSLPLAAFIHNFMNAGKAKKRIVFYIISLLIVFNLFQTLQYRWGVIHFDSMTKEAYFDSFLRISKSENFDKLLKKPDYEKAITTGME